MWGELRVISQNVGGNTPGHMLSGWQTCWKIFNTTDMPTYLKITTIILVPKKSCLNDYHLVTLAAIIMICFERAVILDPLQVANCPVHLADDAIATTLHLTIINLDERTFVRMLFVDFSSASSSSIRNLGLLSPLSATGSWISWLGDCPSASREASPACHSEHRVPPQGSVLSSLLFTLRTYAQQCWSSLMIWPWWVWAMGTTKRRYGCSLTSAEPTTFLLLPTKQNWTRLFYLHTKITLQWTSKAAV